MHQDWSLVKYRNAFQLNAAGRNTEDIQSVLQVDDYLHIVAIKGMKPAEALWYYLYIG